MYDCHEGPRPFCARCIRAHNKTADPIPRPSWCQGRCRGDECLQLPALEPGNQKSLTFVRTRGGISIGFAWNAWHFVWAGVTSSSICCCCGRLRIGLVLKIREKSPFNQKLQRNWERIHLWLNHLKLWVPKRGKGLGTEFSLLYGNFSVTKNTDLWLTQPTEGPPVLLAVLYQAPLDT